MITVDDVIKNLSNNTNLDDQVKDNLKELIIIFNNSFPHVDLTNLNNRVGSLNIVGANKFIIKDIAKYDVVNNVLNINALELSKEYDAKNILMHQLLNIISSRNITTGFIKSNTYVAIYEGYASIVANNLVGNNSDKNPYADEEILVNLLGQITSLEEIETAYFSNNSAPLISSLIQMHNTPEEIKKLMDLAKYNFESRNNPNQSSQLGDIQKRLIIMFTKKSNITEVDMNNFKNQLCGISTIFENEKDRYKGIDSIYDYYNQATSNISLAPSTIETKSR